MLLVHEKDGSMSLKIPDQPMLGFRDYEKVGGIPNKISPVVITTTIWKFDASQILIDS